MNPTPKPTSIEELARELAAAWLEHVYLPGKGTCEAYVAAREALVLAVYPEFKYLPAHNRGDLSFKRGEHSKRWHAAVELIDRLGIRRCPVPRTLQESKDGAQGVQS